jgi:hypothetical protein
MNGWKIATVFIALAGISVAVAGPDFSGDWKLDLEKSDFGQMPAPVAMTYAVKYEDPSMSVKWMFDGEWGRMDGESKYSTDGKPVTNTFGQMSMESTAKWEGATLKVHSTGDFPGGEMTFDDEWTMSADGKTFTIKRTISSDMGVGTQTLVFVKE